MKRLLLALAIATPTSAFGAAATVTIPELRVKWRHARVAGFEILSDCTDAKTRAYAQNVLRTLPLMGLPRAFQPGPRLPQVLILTERFLEDELAPPGCPAELNALRVGSRTIDYSMRNDKDVAVVRVGLARWDPSTSSLELSPLPLRFVPLLLRGRTPQMPAWADAGLMAVHGRAENAIATQERFLQTSAGQGLLTALRDAIDRPERLPPLEELFEETPPPVDPTRNERWRAHAALFTRWAALNKDTKAEKFWEFCDRASREPVTEELFRRCFGTDYAAAQRALAKFLDRALSEPVMLVAPEDQPLPAIPLRDATRAEICRIEGEWQRLTAAALRATHAPLSAVYLARARRTLEHAYGAGEREPQFLAALGLGRLDAGATTDARRALEEAHAAQAVRPLALRTLARLLLAEADQAPAGDDRRHGSAQTITVLRVLDAARRQPPSDADTYRLFAEAWIKSEASPTAAQFAALAEAATSYPREGALLRDLARLAARSGLVAESGQVAQRGLTFAATPELRDEFARLIAAAQAAAR